MITNILSSFTGTLVSTFALVGFAEIGDKSQLVCIGLAARHRAWPVFFGAFTAFFLLNLIAVVFGVAIAQWIPEQVLIIIVGSLFLGFALLAFRMSSGEMKVEENERRSHGIFLTAFLLITVAEFGDKTQIAVAGMGSTYDPFAVWLGATMALVLISGFGVLVGRTLLQHLPLDLLHRISGFIFLVLGLISFISLI